MIIKGKSSTGRGLGAYLLDNKNEHIKILGIRGDIPRDIKDTLNDWRSDSLGTNCIKPLYHAQINPDCPLTPQQWKKAIVLFEKEMGFEKQPRAMVIHQNKGREHLHLVYSRITESGKAISDSWNYLHHEKAARAIERELGLEKTQGVFIERQGERPERTPNHAAIQQGERHNKNPHDIKAKVSTLYQRAKNDGTAFINALEKNGYTLAKGTSNTYVIIDDKGGVHSLSRTARAKVADLQQTLNEYPLQNLPSVEQVRERLSKTQELERESKEQDIIDSPKLEQAIPTEQDEAAKRRQELKDIYRRYEEERAKKQEQELDKGLGRELGRSL